MEKTFITKLVADAVKYLGDKIDKSSNKIQLDLTSRAIEKLQDVDYRQINTLITEMKGIADGQRKSNQELIDTLKAFEKATKDDTKLVDVLITSRNVQKQMLLALDTINKQLVAEANEPEDDKETKEILAALKNVEQAIFKTEKEEKEVDVTPIVKELVELRKVTNGQNKMMLDAIKELAEGIGQLPKKLEIPKEFKLDNEQLRSIRSAGGGGAIVTNGGTKTATNWTVARVSLTSANTEYSYTFPANTQSWTMKLRVAGANLYYSSAAGKLPSSGDNTTYMTMLPLGTRSQDNVEWSGKTIYFESDSAGQVVEIEVFTL